MPGGDSPVLVDAVAGTHLRLFEVFCKALEAWGLSWCLLGGLLHQKDEDIKCSIRAKLQKQRMPQGSGPPRRCPPFLPARSPLLAGGPSRSPPCSAPLSRGSPPAQNPFARPCCAVPVPGAPRGLVRDLAGGIQAGSCPGDPTYEGMTWKGMTSLLGRGHDYHDVFYGYSVFGGSWLLVLDLWLHVSKKTQPTPDSAGV